MSQLPWAQTKSSLWCRAFLRPHIQLGLRVCFSVHVDFGLHRPSCSRLWICVNDFPDKGGKSVEHSAPSPWSSDEDGGGVGRPLGSVLGGVTLLGPASWAGAGPGPSAAPLADFGAQCLPLRLQGAVCLWSLGHLLSLHPVRETTIAPWSSRHGLAAPGCNCESAHLAGRGRWKLGRGGEESRGKLLKCPHLKLLSSPPLWGLRLQRWWGCCRTVAPSTPLGVHAEPGRAPRPRGQCTRGPHLPRGRIPEGNAVTAALRKEEKLLREETQIHPQPCYPLLRKETRDRHTDNIALKSFSKKKLCLLWGETKNLSRHLFSGKTTFTSLLSKVKIRAPWPVEPENLKSQIKGISDIIKGKTKLSFKKNLKYNKGGIHNREVCVDRAWSLRSFIPGLVSKRIQYRSGRETRPALMFSIFFSLHLCLYIPVGWNS